MQFCKQNSGLNGLGMQTEVLYAIFKYAGSKMQFYKQNMHLNDFYKHAEDLCAIFKTCRV